MLWNRNSVIVKKSLICWMEVCRKKMYAVLNLHWDIKFHDIMYLTNSNAMLTTMFICVCLRKRLNGIVKIYSYYTGKI